MRAFLTTCLCCLLVVATVVWWSSGVVSRAGSVTANLDALIAEDDGMVEWWHTPEGGSVMHIVVRRSNYGSDQEWLAAIQTMQAAFPPNTDPP